MINSPPASVSYVHAPAPHEEIDIFTIFRDQQERPAGEEIVSLLFHEVLSRPQMGNQVSDLAVLYLTQEIETPVVALESCKYGLLIPYVLWMTLLRIEKHACEMLARFR